MKEYKPHKAHVSPANQNTTIRSIQKWLLAVWVAVVIGACCCSGLVIVGYNTFSNGNVNPILMVAIIGPMGVIMAFLLERILRAFVQAVSELGNGLHRIAAGDYSVRLNTKHNITTTKDMFEDFNLMAENLQRNELLRESFVADFSHEFKTPINSINGFAELLIDNIEASKKQGAAQNNAELNSENQTTSLLTPEEQETYLHTIATESGRLASLASNTLLLNSLDVQTILAQSGTYRLDEQIRECLVVMQPEWSKKQLNLDIGLQEILFTGNEAMLKEVWINLLNNAIKFSPDGGTLGVTLVCESACAHQVVHVYIRDTGIGMSAQVKARIFERYYQGDASHATQGHGLGLAITQRIVQLSHGTIEVESTPGKGSTFIVTLPLKKW